MNGLGYYSHTGNNALVFHQHSHIYRVVQSFEIVAYSFAQQLGVNETQDITLNSLTILTELVSNIHLPHLQ